MPVTTMDSAAVYPAQRDTWLLAEVLDTVLDEDRCPGAAPRRVLELGTGSGALAVRAARRVDTEVTAVDICPHAVRAARRAAHAEGVSTRVLVGDLTEPVADERFDLVIANPPYVPAPESVVPADGPARAWDAGRDGRLVLDRVCREVPRVLAPGAQILIVHSALAGVAATLAGLRGEELAVEVAASRVNPFGPVLHGRAPYLESVGLLEPGRRDEELVVIRGQA